VTQLLALASCRLQRIPSNILVFGGNLAFLLPTDFRGNDPLESQSGEPSKNELKKRAKAAEKERKAAEKAARLAGQQREKAAAEEVRHLSPQTLYHLLTDFTSREKPETISHESSTVNFLSTSLSHAPGSRDTRFRPSHLSWMGRQSSSVHACTLSVVRETKCF
jgi:hypothetical protein